MSVTAFDPNELDLEASPMTRCLTLILLIYSHTCLSGTIEVAQWIPWAFLKNQFLSSTSKYELNQIYQQIEVNGFKPNIIYNVKLEGEIPELEFEPEGIRSIIKARSVIQIQRISIDQIIERNIAGNIFRLHIKAECGPFEVKFNNLEVKNRIRYRSNGTYWVPEIDESNIVNESSQIDVTQFSCSGIDRIGEELITQLRAELSDLNKYSIFINELINEYLSSESEKIIKKIESLTEDQIEITHIAEPDQKGLIVYGFIKTIGMKKVILKNIDHKSLSDNSPQLLMSKEGFESLIEENIKKMIPTNYNLQLFKPFSDLMASRIKQFFVWPDLRRFPKNNPFLFKQNDDTLNFSMQKTSTKNLYDSWFYGLGSINTTIGGSDIEYLQLYLNLKSQLFINIDNGVLTINSKSSAVELKWAYGLLYQMIYKPDNRIASQLIADAMGTFLSNKSYQVNLPSIKIDALVFRISKWKEENDLITMDWE